MSRPVLLKLGGSVLTDKAAKPRFKKTVARRLLGEAAKMDVPLIVMHGAGAFGHPLAKRHELGLRAVTPERRIGISETLASVATLHAAVTQAGVEAGLRTMPVPLHLTCQSEADGLVDVPVDRIQRLVDEGFTPVLCGTVVRDDRLGWRVVSADEMMEALAPEVDPRLAIFATDVEGVFDRDPGHADAQVIPVLGLDGLDRIDAASGHGDDVTGRMRGKLERAFHVAAHCPTWIVDGTVRGRVQDVLKGKTVPGTRLEA